jgi:hypothetical protein
MKFVFMKNNIPVPEMMQAKCKYAKEIMNIFRSYFTPTAKVN